MEGEEGVHAAVVLGRRLGYFGGHLMDRSNVPPFVDSLHLVRVAVFVYMIDEATIHILS
jgi:predicted ABC-type sugar transport system permease subunit